MEIKKRMMKDVPMTLGGAVVISVVLRVDENWESLEEALRPYYLLDNGAVVSASAEIGKDALIGFGCFVGEATIGNRVVLSPFSHVGDVCVIEDDTIVGKHTTVSIGCSIGASSVLGDCCLLGYENHLPAGTRLPDFTTIATEAIKRGDEVPALDMDRVGPAIVREGDYRLEISPKG